MLRAWLATPRVFPLITVETQRCNNTVSINYEIPHNLTQLSDASKPVHHMMIFHFAVICLNLLPKYQSGNPSNTTPNWIPAIVPNRVGYPYRIVPYHTFPLRFGSARAGYYRAPAEHTPCTVRYDLFCEPDMVIRYGSINVRFGSQMYGRNPVILC